ncbi:MAG: 23S rRNA (adenine(2503)-C(2))-methyltransferase RlmN [bacterium]|nr:23S rRNA (adenine(2503)-C(2))-methyltransferase RlmN [bacterium]
MRNKPLLRSLVPREVGALATGAGEPAYRGGQLVDWVFAHGALAWDEMTNLPASLRTGLAAAWDLSALEPAAREVSSDGTRKFLFRLRDGQTIESVIIPMAEHATFCLSTQVGCAMACRFCATARGGLIRNLEAGEIVEQVLRLRHDLATDPVSGHGDRGENIVFMGMGEPLDNWPDLARSLDVMLDPDGLALSRRRIQISTSGPREGLQKLLAAAPGVGLTLSLGGVDDVSRRKLMPVPGRTPVAEAVGLAADYARAAGRRATVAWVLIAGRTDGVDQAEALARLMAGGPFKVNLIPFNALDDDDLVRPDRTACEAFQAVLTAAGIPVFIRDSGGRDIAAACGQLRRRRLST